MLQLCTQLALVARQLAVPLGSVGQAVGERQVRSGWTRLAGRDSMEQSSDSSGPQAVAVVSQPMTSQTQDPEPPPEPPLLPPVPPAPPSSGRMSGRARNGLNVSAKASALKSSTATAVANLGRLGLQGVFTRAP